MAEVEAAVYQLPNVLAGGGAAAGLVAFLSVGEKAASALASAYVLLAAWKRRRPVMRAAPVRRCVPCTSAPAGASGSATKEKVSSGTSRPAARPVASAVKLTALVKVFRPRSVKV